MAIIRKSNLSIYLKQRMKKVGLPASNLYYGIMEKRSFYRILNDEHHTNFWIMHHLLARMGIDSNSMIKEVDSSDYFSISLRNEIVYHLNNREFYAAEKLLDKKWLSLCENNRILNQFYYRVKSIVAIEQNRPSFIIQNYLESALTLTIPNYKQINCLSLCLSYQELDLLLDYYNFVFDSRATMFLDIYAYVNNRYYDNKCISYIQPKALVYYLNHIHKDICSIEISDTTKIIELCYDTLAVLKKNNSLYYLFEIHKHLAQILEHLYEHTLHTDYLTMLQESEALLQTLVNIETSTRTTLKTSNSSVIYACNRVDKTNAIIFLRRTTLGLSRKELCKNICDITTLKRIEQGKTVPYTYTKNKLYEKLSLPTEQLKDALLLKDDRQRNYLTRYRHLVNQAKWDEAETVLNELSGICDLQDKYNLQSLMRMFDACAVEKNHMNSINSMACARFNLELTISLEKIKNARQIYLTQNELLCLLDYVRACDVSRKREALLLVERYFNQLSAIAKYINWMHRTELIICTLLDEYLNLHELEKVITYSNTLLQMSLMNKRSYFLSDLLYIQTRINPDNNFVIPAPCFQLLAKLASNNHRLVYYQGKL